MNRLSLFAIAFAASTSLACAADLGVYKPAPQPYIAAPTWTGFYVGAQAGYGWGSMRDHNNPIADRKEIDGFVGGIQAGYNYQLPSNIVLGVEASLLLGDASNEWNGNEFNVLDSYYTKDKLNVLGTLRARVGYDINGFLPYVTGGLAIGNTDHKLGCDHARAPLANGCQRLGPFEASGSDTSLGYVLGGGVEYAVTRNWSARAEYLYTQLGANSVTLVDPYYPIYTERKFKTRFSTVTFGVNYKF